MKLSKSVVDFVCMVCLWKVANSRPSRMNDSVLPSSSSNSTLNKTQSAMDIITNVNQAKDLTYLYEGDINLFQGSELQDMIKRENSEIQSIPQLVEEKRDAMRAREYLWKSRIVPYYISPELENYEYSIKEAMDEISRKSCISFVEKTDQANWIEFVRRAGCWSSVGMLYDSTGPQEISLGNGCFDQATMIHEMLHSLGFWHEQSRPDRDRYVEIFWENIIPGQEHNFEKYSHKQADILGVEYDLSSVMHYGSKAFSKNGEITIKAIHNTDIDLGAAEGLSELDAVQLNALYDCKNFGNNSWSAWSSYSPCDENCMKYRQRFCSNGTNCQGSNEFGVETHKEACKQDSTECYAPINGHWSRWGGWTECSSSCGQGKQQRKRTCTGPAPKYNGKPCEGSSTGSQVCKRRTCSLGPDDCEFEYGKFCFWTNNIENAERYTWSRNSGSTPSKRTGPEGDHTSNNGHYLFLEGSSPAEEEDKAALVSKLFKGGGTRCLQFFYYMFGSAIGSLKVYMDVASSSSKQLLWEKVGDQGSIWAKGQVSFQSNEDYKIIFEGQRGSGFTSDIAIDDVMFLEENCTHINTSAVSVTTTPSTEPSPQPITHIAEKVYKQIGCFKDYGIVNNRRPFPSYIDYRPQINWGNMQKTIEDCAQKVKELNYDVFAIQYYGECWFGSKDQVNYVRDGMTSDCWNGVGRSHTMFVYQWE